MAATLRRAALLGIGLASALLLGASPVHLVHDFSPGEFTGDRPLPQLTRLGETLFFVAAEPETGSTLWRTDGTAAGSRRVLVAGDPGIFDDPKVIGTVGGHLLDGEIRGISQPAGAPGRRRKRRRGRRDDLLP